MLIELMLIGGGRATYLRKRNQPNTKTTALEPKNKAKKTVSLHFSGKKLLQVLKTAMLSNAREKQRLTLEANMQISMESTRVNTKIATHTKVPALINLHTLQLGKETP